MIEFEDDQTSDKHGRYLVLKIVMEQLRSESTTDILLSCPAQANRFPSGENATLWIQLPVRLETTFE